MIYQSTNVNEAYASRIIPAQYTNSWLLPGVTCNSEPITGDPVGGAFNFFIQNASTANAPTVVGAAYTPGQAANTMKTIYTVNEYTEPNLLPIMAANTMTADAKGAVFVNQQASIRTRRQRSAIACLINGIGASALGALTAQTFASATVYDTVQADRASVFDACGKTPNICLMKTTVFNKLRGEIGAKYTPVFNDSLTQLGINNFMMDGCTFIPCADLANAANVDYTWKKDSDTSNDVTIGAAQIKKLNYICYNSDDLALIDVLTDVKDEKHQGSASWLLATTFTSGLGMIRTNSAKASVSATW